MCYKVSRIIKQIAVLALLFTASPTYATPINRARTNSTSISAKPVQVTSEKAVSVKFSYILPPHSELNKGAPSDVMVHDGETVLATQKITSADTTLSIPSGACTKGTIFVDSSIFFCGVIDRVCKIKSFSVEQKCSTDPKGNGEISITTDINSYL